MVKTAIILAGGLGTRLRDAVPNLPKAMAPINNRPFLEYQLDYWIRQGINNFILSVGYLSDLIIGHFGKSYKGASIKYNVESEPLGTGGGMFQAAIDLNEIFLVLNGDTFIEVDLKNLYKFHLQSKSNWTFALFRTSESDRYLTMEISSNGQIFSSNNEQKESSGLANGGVYLIDPVALNLLGISSGDSASLEDQLIPNLVSNGGRVFGLECKGKFIDIGIPEDYYRLSDILPISIE